MRSRGGKNYAKFLHKVDSTVYLKVYLSIIKACIFHLQNSTNIIFHFTHTTIMNSNTHRRQRLEYLIEELSNLDERRKVVRDEIAQLLADIQQHETESFQIVLAKTAEEFYLHGDKGKGDEEQYCYIAYLGKGFKCCRRFWGVLLGRTQNNALWEMHVDAWIRRSQVLHKKSIQRENMLMPRYAVMPTFFNNDFVEFKWERIVQTATGSLKIFPAWWEVDIVLIPISCPNEHWFLLQLKISTLELTIFDRELARVPDAHRSCIMTCYEENLVRFLEEINYTGRGPIINARKPFGYVARVTQYPNSRQNSALFICLFIHYILTNQTREIVTADVSNEQVEEFREGMATAFYAKRLDLTVG